mmetsp:Transcript_177439/g.569014  ORF Transcript_177439/g.569014 Transcript_177439/m.569014 type:complete len:258 (+) Transcript_177439:130-903(+)
MGHKHSKTADSCAQGDTAFKLFEYQCTTCRSKRPIQYFYKNGKFLPQTPRVVCGECNTSVAVEPFKTVEYGCPSCKRWQKARLPARPIPLNMYNVSVVSCNCGFKGEVNVGRLMDVACCQCWQHRRELCDVWLEDGDELRHYCGNCKDERRCIAQVPKKKGTEPAEDLEYACDECKDVRPVHAEELLRNEGLACCTACNWVGYPEVHPRGHFEKLGLQREAARRGSGTPKKQGSGRSGKKVKPEPDAVAFPMSPVVP